MCAVQVTGNQIAQVTGNQIAQVPKALSRCVWFVEEAVLAPLAREQWDRQVHPGPPGPFLQG